MKYHVKTIHDDYDCEDCGASYAEGFEIYRDGKLVHTMKPVAHCLGGEFYTTEDWAVWIIRDLGGEVWIDGWEAAILPTSDTPPILRHNGVGEADMYSDEELKAELYPESKETPQPTQNTMPLDEDLSRYAAPPSPIGTEPDDHDPNDDRHDPDGFESEIWTFAETMDIIDTI